MRMSIILSFGCFFSGRLLSTTSFSAKALQKQKRLLTRLASPFLTSYFDEFTGGSGRTQARTSSLSAQYVNTDVTAKDSVNGHSIKGHPAQKMPLSVVKRDPLAPSKLRWKCDPAQFEFHTTAELNQLNGSFPILGQERAQSAIEFGVGMQQDGYNLFVLGPSGVGKRTVVQKYLEEHAKEKTAPMDWCYVNNFEDTDKPKAIALAPGLGRILAEDVKNFIEDLKVSIPATLESPDHRHKLEAAQKDIISEYDSEIEALQTEAVEHNMTLVKSQEGTLMLLIPEKTDSMPAMEKKDIQDAAEELTPKIEKLFKQLPQFLKKVRETIKELNKVAAKETIEVSIAPLKERYAHEERVLAHLEACERDIIENAHAFQTPAEGVQTVEVLLGKPREKYFGRYLINVIVEHGDTVGAPVVFEDHPYYHKLMGRIEHESQLGSFTTDFSQIKAGALHQSNGGYLVLRARDVLLQPFCWEALKRALRSGRVQMDSLGNELSIISTASLQPEPIPLDLKVVLLGDRMLYYFLQAHDDEFSELFKVEADFNVETDRTEETCQLFANMLGSLAKKEGLRPLDRKAVALMMEQAARACSDQEKLSTHMRSTDDLLRESDYWACKDNANVTGEEHVTKAITQQIYRADRIRELVHEQIKRGKLLVDVEGEQIGQVNGLSVMSLGNLAFGRPSRITATARLGRGKVVDVEREVELGGPIHSKGVMILTSLLASRYARDFPLSLSASLVFEQSYGMVEGDSASVAEFCALLSVLAEVPIQQGLAITGSLNQKGQAQPIGGVNEKIEGYFDVCNATGMTGDQGVLIPSSNAKDLMLRPDVVEAVEAGKFAVYTYDTVDDAMALLTNMEAGVRDTSGSYPSNTVNGRVDERLRKMADLMLSFSEGSQADNDTEDKKLLLKGLHP